MKTTQKSTDRGHTKISWLNSHHSFSFGSYFNPSAMGFRSLRVINDDRVAPGQGFGTHGHANMEIITYVIEGALEHRDSLGTGSVIRPGDIQRMSAGRGIRHSEFNASKTQPVRFLQIWIPPAQDDLAPSYEQKSIKPGDGEFVLLVSPDGEAGSVKVHQDARLYSAHLAADAVLTRDLDASRYYWLQVVTGTLSLDDQRLEEGDSVAITGETRLDLVGGRDAEVLLFDLA
jgi:redox-sensitive bicupin YhaK (pirin superfamily)